MAETAKVDKPGGTKRTKKQKPSDPKKKKDGKDAKTARPAAKKGARSDKKVKKALPGPGAKKDATTAKGGKKAVKRAGPSSEEKGGKRFKRSTEKKGNQPLPKSIPSKKGRETGKKAGGAAALGKFTGKGRRKILIKKKELKELKKNRLASRVGRFSKYRTQHKKGLYPKVRRGGRKTKEVEPRSAFIKKPIGGEKNGGFRLVRRKKLPRYYPTQPKPKKPSTKQKCFYQHERKLRKTITPGTVLIIVAGKHRGKRVVFLKMLRTGLLLVTGPFMLNMCPLRRINQIYVIATKTKLNIDKVNIPKHLNDKYFKRKHPKKGRKDEGNIFETKKETYRVTQKRKKDQILVDRQILNVIHKSREKKEIMGYLSSTFQLRNGMYPHKMIF